MNRFRFTLVVIVAVITSTLSLMAQQKRVSPHETISEVFDGNRNNRVTIIYGRPYSKDPKSGEARKIWGTLVPYAKIWRMGADEATLLITQQSIVMGETTIPAGAYTLAMQPEENGAAKLMINKQVGQWGVPYVGKDTELARIDLKKDSLETPVNQFTMAIERNPSGGGVLKMMWENTQFSVPFTVKK